MIQTREERIVATDIQACWNAGVKTSGYLALPVVPLEDLYVGDIFNKCISHPRSPALIVETAEFPDFLRVFGPPTPGVFGRLFAVRFVVAAAVIRVSFPETAPILGFFLVAVPVIPPAVLAIPFGVSFSP